MLGTLTPQFFPELSRYGAFLAAFATGLGLIFSRDNNVSSEDVGAKSGGVSIPVKMVLLSLLPVFLLTGCASPMFSKTATPQEKSAHIQQLTTAAASIGTSLTLQANPAYRPAFELAYADLNALVTQKTVTGETLRSILDTLHVKELKDQRATIAIEGATFLYDSLVGSKVNIESQPYVEAAATGIRDGIGVALGKSPPPPP